MNKHLFLTISALFLLGACTSKAPTSQQEVKRWAAYYNDELPAKNFRDLDLVVFDRVRHPDLKPLKGKTKALAYVSIGEVHDDIKEKQQLEAKNLLLAQNGTWKSHIVDITAPEWNALVLDSVDNAAKKGFDGVMLDTVDSPIYWAQKHAPERVADMRKAAVTLIFDIKRQHPGMKIMLNRGFDLLPLISPEIDYVLAESIMTNTDVSTGQFGLFPSNTYAQAAEQLHHVVALAPHLQVVTLDYWNKDDVAGIERIEAAQRAQGFAPYVTTPDLRSFTPRS